MPIGFDDLVNDVMNDWPATIRVFLDFKMGCVGCPIACFHTVDDACSEYHVDCRLPEGAARSRRINLGGHMPGNRDFRSRKLIWLKSFPAQSVVFELQATKQAEIQATEGLKP